MPILSSVLVTLVLTSPLQGPASGAAPVVSHREYLETVIRALSQAHDAIAAVNKEDAGDIFGRMTALKNAKFEVEIAARRLAPFANVTDNENRKAASDAFVTAFAMLLKSLEGQVSLYERLDAASTAEDLKGMRSAASDAAVLAKQSTKLMCDAVGLSVASAVVPDPADPANHIALAMSAADKDSLVKMLKNGFDGTLVKTIGNTGPANAAKLILDTLGDDWRLAPQK